MPGDQSSSNKHSARILNFRRGAKGLPQAGPVRDLARYERGTGDPKDIPDDYRHRMFVNAAAFLFVIALIVTGVWIADTMSQMRKNQDCVLSGRRGCSPIDVTPKPRP